MPEDGATDLRARRRGWDDPAALIAGGIGLALGLMAGVLGCLSTINLMIYPQIGEGTVWEHVPTEVLWTAPLWMSLALGLTFRGLVAQTRGSTATASRRVDRRWRRLPAIAVLGVLYAMTVVAAFRKLSDDPLIFLLIPSVMFAIGILLVCQSGHERTRAEER